MGNMTNIFIFYLTISLFLYGAEIKDSHGLLFASDLITQYVTTDSSGNIQAGYNQTFVDNGNRISNYGANGVSSGTSFFNFWDALQIFWSFLKMIFNIFFIIPKTLLSLGLPVFLNIFIVLMLIIGIAVFTFGMMGKR